MHWFQQRSFLATEPFSRHRGVFFCGRPVRIATVLSLESTARRMAVESGILPTCVLFLSVPFVCCLFCCPLALEFQKVELSRPGQLSEMNIAERGGSEVAQRELIELID